MSSADAKILKLIISILAAVAFSFQSTSVRAADLEQRNWYGWQLMIIDVPSVGLLYAGSAFVLDSEDAGVPLVVVGLLGYTIASPSVHLLRQQWWKAAASLGLRIGLPLASLFGTRAILNDDSLPVDTFGWSLLAGAVVAMIVDYSVFAFAPVLTSPENRSSDRAQMLQLGWRF